MNIYERALRGRSAASSRSTRATRALLSGAKDDSANLEGEEPVEAPPIEVVETQATQQKEEEDDDADDL